MRIFHGILPSRDSTDDELGCVAYGCHWSDIRSPCRLGTNDTEDKGENNGHNGDTYVQAVLEAEDQAGEECGYYDPASPHPPRDLLRLRSWVVDQVVFREFYLTDMEALEEG